MKSLFVLMALLWVCVLAPSLCLGGGLVHACECGLECTHEDDCERDPCAPVLKAEESSSLSQPHSPAVLPVAMRGTADGFRLSNLLDDRASTDEIQPARLQPALELPLLR